MVSTWRDPSKQHGRCTDRRQLKFALMRTDRKGMSCLLVHEWRAPHMAMRFRAVKARGQLAPTATRNPLIAPTSGSTSRQRCRIFNDLPSDGGSAPIANRSPESFHTYSGSTALGNFETGSKKASRSRAQDRVRVAGKKVGPSRKKIERELGS